MTKFADRVAQDVLEELKQRFSDAAEDDRGVAYADLSGRALSADGYIELLEGDEDFAFEQYEIHLKPDLDQVTFPDENLGPEGQRLIAKRIVERHKRCRGKKSHLEALGDYLNELNEISAGLLGEGDIREVVKILRFEMGWEDLGPKAKTVWKG